MPHLLVNRKRHLNLSKHPHTESFWGYINAVLYLFGGALFVIGSIFFIPSIESAYPKTGAYIFIIGSIFYLIVVCHDFAEVSYYWKEQKHHSYWLKLEYWVSIIYIVASLLFIIGSIAFLPSYEDTELGSWCFIIGSLLFFIAACINILQIEQEDNQQLLFIKNSIAVNFLAGSVIFTMASVPYLWKLETHHDHLITLGFSAEWFIIGSLFFLIGGIIGIKKVRS